MKYFKSSELKILLAGALLGIILTFLCLRLLNLPILYQTDDLVLDEGEFQLELDEQMATVSSENVDTQQF